MMARHTWLRSAFLAASMAACAAPLKSERVRPAAAAPAEGHKAGKVVVLKSDQNPLFDEVFRVFEEQTDFELVYYTLTADTRAPDVQNVTAQEKASLIISAGTRAAKLAAEAIGDVPVLFLMVPNGAHITALHKANVAGISLEAPTASDFAQFKLVAPRIKRVLTFYSDESKDVVLQAKTDLVAWGIDIVAVPATGLPDIQAAYEKLSGAFDGVWLQNDNVVMNLNTFMFLRDATIRSKVAFLTSLSANFAKAGALVSVSIDFSALGSQAANIASRLLNDKTPPADVGIEPPIGGSIAINMDTAASIGVEIPQRALLVAQDVIGMKDEKSTGTTP